MSGRNAGAGGTADGSSTNSPGPASPASDGSASDDAASDHADPWSVYILRCADGSLYTGITNRLEARLTAHNEGRGAKYTRSRLPIELVFEEARPDRSAALRREAEIKTYSRAEKKALIATAASEGSRHTEDG